MDITARPVTSFNIRTKPVWMREFFAEFFGTFFIVCLGDGAIANYLLNQDHPTDVDHFAVCFTFGVGVLIGISISARISGGHLNPAVTIAMASMRKFPLKKVPLYLLAQYFGSFMAAFAIFCVYYEGIEAYDDGVRIAYKIYPNTTGMTGHIFSTYPASHVSVIGTLVDQTLATFLLLFAVMAVTDENGINTPKHLQPTVLALVITGLCVAFGLNCGAVLNPARDFAPRLFQAMAGYDLKPFLPVQSLYWLTAGIVGPHLGGVLGVWAYRLTICNETDDMVEANDNNLKDYKMTAIYKSDDKMNRYKEDSHKHRPSKDLMDDLEKSRPLMTRTAPIDVPEDEESRNSYTRSNNSLNNNSGIVLDVPH